MVNDELALGCVAPHLRALSMDQRDRRVEFGLDGCGCLLIHLNSAACVTLDKKLYTIWRMVADQVVGGSELMI